jgi:hypothetical protein
MKQTYPEKSYEEKDPIADIVNEFNGYLSDSHPMSLLRFNPAYFPSLLSRRRLVMQIALIEDGGTLKSAMSESLQLHVFMDLFFATIVATPIIQSDIAWHTDYLSIAYLIYLHVTFAIQLTSMFLQIMMLSVIECIPDDMFRVWIADRISPMQLFLSIHVMSFILFISAMMVWPIVYYTSTLTKYICPLAEVAVYFVFTSKFGIADQMFQIVSPVLSRRASPYNKNLKNEIKLFSNVTKAKEKSIRRDMSRNSIKSCLSSKSLEDGDGEAKSLDMVNEIMSLEDFLKIVNLEIYLGALKSRDVNDVETLSHMQPGDYKDISVCIGHRIKIEEELKAILGRKEERENDPLIVSPTRRRRRVFGGRRQNSLC